MTPPSSKRQTCVQPILLTILCFIALSVGGYAIYHFFLKPKNKSTTAEPEGLLEEPEGLLEEPED